MKSECSPVFLCFDIFLLKTHKETTRRSRRSFQKYAKLTITTSNFIVSSRYSRPTQQKLRVGGNNIMVGVVVKSKIGYLEEEVRADSLRRMRKDLTGVVQGVSGSKRFLVRFQDGC